MAEVHNPQTSRVPVRRSETDGDAALSYGREDRSWFDAAPEAVEPAPIAQQPDLAARVEEALKLDTMLNARRIHVHLEDGTVVLAGAVQDGSDHALAGLIARRQPGVSRLENRLKIDPDSRADFSPDGSDHALTSTERFADWRCGVKGG